MGHIDRHDGRFITVLPRSRSEDGRLRERITQQAPDWSEACRRPGKRKGDPDQVWKVCPAPFPTSEGYRITWVHSRAKQHRDEIARTEGIDRASQALTELSERLAGPRARITTRVAAEEAAGALLATSGAERWVTVTVTETVEERYRQGETRPAGQDTRYRKIEKTRFALEVSVDDKQVRYDAACDGCFPLTTNDPKLTDTDVLAAYRYQPNLVKRHHELESVQDAAPVQLKSPFRIEALFACQFIALLTNCQLVALRWIASALDARGPAPKSDASLTSHLIPSSSRRRRSGGRLLPAVHHLLAPMGRLLARRGGLGAAGLVATTVTVLRVSIDGGSRCGEDHASPLGDRSGSARP